MSKIYIKVMSEDALNYLKQNIERITSKIQENESNEWIYDEFPKPLFIEKKYQINDFDIKDNKESKNKQIDLDDSIEIYKSLKQLPRYILTNQCFWLWLHFEKFYGVVKNMMPIQGKSTILDHWTHSQGVRRGIMFGVLSRCYFRVALSVDKNADDPYYLTKWVIDNPLRFRELTWRTYSSEEHIVRGVLKGEKKAIEKLNFEKNVYPEIAKCISLMGGVKLLDSITEDEIEKLTYDKMIELLS